MGRYDEDQLNNFDDELNNFDDETALNFSGNQRAQGQAPRKASFDLDSVTLTINVKSKYQLWHANWVSQIDNKNPNDFLYDFFFARAGKALGHIPLNANEKSNYSAIAHKV